MRFTMNCTLTSPTWCRHLTSVVILEIFKIKRYSLVWKQWNCITCTQPPLSCMHSPGFALLAEVCPCSKARNKICQIKLVTIQIFSFPAFEYHIVNIPFHMQNYFAISIVVPLSLATCFRSSGLVDRSIHKRCCLIWK
jgi:hypothetical protein